MTSTFKLTMAEFKKIFKRPSIFIMAILLVVTIFASISIFSPLPKVDDTLNYDNVSNASQYYSTFNSNTIDSKLTFDTNIANTQNTILFYKDYNTYLEELTEKYNSSMTAIHELLDETNSQIREVKKTEFLNNLTNFKAYFETIGELGSKYPNITDKILGEWWPNNNYYLVDSTADLNKLISFVASNNANNVANFYNTNNFEELLKNTLQKGKNFINTTLLGFSVRFSHYYNEYDKYLNLARSDLSTIIANKKALYNILLNLNEFLESLLKNENPLILITKSDYNTCKSKIDEALELLKDNATKDSNLDYHKQIRYDLESNGINNYLINFTSTIYNNDSSVIEVSLPLNLINELENIGEVVESNKEDILSNMDSYKTDETLKNISFEGTKYKLLSISYNDIVQNKIMLSITSNFDKSQYSKFYGYDFDKFNKYSAKEIISRNQYYIDNNIYSNSFISNFSFSQNSGSSTNVWDFMYFTMELCTLIIIVFAMMLVCSLITGETESGTIKLLLVRPFKRSKIITAKLFATIFFVITFMLFSSVISFVGGYFLYGYTAMPILATFNASTSFQIHPLALMAINILSLTLDVIFFVILALMISIICKNYAGSISACLVLLIINFAFNILFGGSFWYTLLPGMNTHLFKYFGNSFIASGGTTSIAGLIQSLLITGIENSMTIIYSVIIMLIYSAVFLAVSYAVFQKRDF